VLAANRHLEYPHYPYTSDNWLRATGNYKGAPNQRAINGHRTSSHGKTNAHRATKEAN